VVPGPITCFLLLTQELGESRSFSRRKNLAVFSESKGLYVPKHKPEKLEDALAVTQDGPFAGCFFLVTESTVFFWNAT